MIDGRHIYQGDCPDDDNGPYSRDPECPVCRAIMHLELYGEALTSERNWAKANITHEQKCGRNDQVQWNKGYLFAIEHIEEIIRSPR